MLEHHTSVLIAAELYYSTTEPINMYSTCTCQCTVHEHMFACSVLPCTLFAYKSMAFVSQVHVHVPFNADISRGFGELGRAISSDNPTN